MSERKYVERSWIKKDFAEKFDPDIPRLEVIRETEKAVLLSDVLHDAWVPKSCIDDGKLARQRKELENGISMPLKKAGPDEYKNVLKVPLFDYQRDIIKTLEGCSRAYLGQAMGTGKTPVSIARTILFDDDLPTLLICEKSLMDQWRSEIDKFAPWMQDRFEIINYDRIFRDRYQEYMDSFKKDKFNLILEEVGCLGNENAKRTAYCMKLAKRAKNVQLLTGSMFGGHFEKLYPCTVMQGATWTREQFDKLFTVQIHQKVTVNTRWGVQKKDSIQIVGYKNIDKLIDAMAAKGAVFVRSEDALDLPEENEQIIRFKQTTAARKTENTLYNAVSRGEAVEVNSWTRLKTLNSLSDNKEKLEWVKDTLEASDDRWLIFYQFNDERKWLLEICKKLNRPVSEISGHVSDKDAYENKSNSVTILQIKSGKNGHNLQKCNHAIFTSPFDADSMIQAKKRIRRPGQTKKCFYYVLATDGRFDESQLNENAKNAKNVESIKSDIER
jgi:hypothetical protein